MKIQQSHKDILPPVKLPFLFKTPILACGAQSKNTFCLAKDDYAFISPEVGDLENLEALTAFEEGIERSKHLLDIEPKILACDLHPEYLSTKFAHDYCRLSTVDCQPFFIQHHHAHVASCMADSGIAQKVIGVAFDGTGYGEDETIWGGEFLVADFGGYQRVAHLKYIPMPGGGAAIKEPWRMAATWLYQVYDDDFLKLELNFVRRLDKDKWQILNQMISRKVNTPLTSSMGRFFDAVSSLVGIRDEVAYEGQAAIELEKKAVTSHQSPIASYQFEISEEDGIFIIDPKLIIMGVVKDLESGFSVSEISTKFHTTIADLIVRICTAVRENTGLNDIVLSGGVFQNTFLFNKTLPLLKTEHFRVHTHNQVSPNDGGISLGQAVIANSRIE